MYQQQPKYGQGQNIYGNQQKQNSGKNYPQYNPQMQNQNQSKANGNQKSVNSNQKYGDLEIQTFFNDGKNTGISAKDLELKENLETITNQYMSVFGRINELANKFGNGNDNMYKVGMIQKDLEQVEFYNSNEYANFIGQLFEITNAGHVANLSYDKYKSNPIEGEQKLKQVMRDYKYDIIKYISKDIDEENKRKINKYVMEKKKKNQNDNYYNNNSNQNMSPAPNQGSNYNPNNNYQSNGNNYYNNNNYNNGGNNYRNNYNNNNNYSGGNNIYGDNRPRYNYPNGDNNKNNQYPRYGNNTNPSSMRVTFVVNGREITNTVNSNDSGEVLQLFALQEKENPKIYDIKKRFLPPDDLVEMKVKDIFSDCDPILYIY